VILTLGVVTLAGLGVALLGITQLTTGFAPQGQWGQPPELMAIDNSSRLLAGHEQRVSPRALGAAGQAADQILTGQIGAQATFDGRPLRKMTTMQMTVTAYSPDAGSCGKWADGITASGYSVWTNGMKLVAADTSLLPFGTLVSVPGYNAGQPVPVLDRGGKIKGYRLDLLHPTHDLAMQWGKHAVDVTVWEYAD